MGFPRGCTSTLEAGSATDFSHGHSRRPAIGDGFHISSLLLLFVYVTQPVSSAPDASGRVHFTQHEKPLAQYLYIPWGSSHSAGTKTGVIISGLIRIARRFSRGQPASLLNAARERFFTRLRARGYPNSALRKAMRRVQQSPKSTHTGPIARISAHPRARPLAKALRRCTKTRVQTITPVTMFLKNFKRTWCTRQPEKRQGGMEDSENFF